MNKSDQASTASTASATSKNIVNENWNPWKVQQVNPSDLIVNKFQSWDKTQDPRPRLKAWNRAQKWVSDLIRLPFHPPAGHALRVIDKEKGSNSSRNTSEQELTSITEIKLIKSTLHALKNKVDNLNNTSTSNNTSKNGKNIKLLSDQIDKLSMETIGK